MGQAARKIDQPTAVAAPRARADGAGSEWSGRVYGSVAEMHRAIEAGLAGGAALASPVPALSPVERTLRVSSRLFGWGALVVSAAAVTAALF